jgi:hypothetical protein
VPTELFGVGLKARYAAHGWDMYGIFGAIKEFYTPTKADDDFETTFIFIDSFCFTRSYFSLL